jgi:hypothetical protein
MIPQMTLILGVRIVKAIAVSGIAITSNGSLKPVNTSPITDLTTETVNNLKRKGA